MAAMNEAVALVEQAARAIALAEAGDVEALRARIPALLEVTGRFGARWNLVGDASPLGVVREHVIETMSLAACAGGAQPTRVVDVGAGAGLELLVLLLLWPEARGLAVEPRRKRTDFLEIAAAGVGVGRRLEVVRARLGEPGCPTLDGAFELATSRATFAPDRWLTLGAPLCSPTGRVAAHLPAGETVTPPIGWVETARRAVWGRADHEVVHFGRA